MIDRLYLACDQLVSKVKIKLTGGKSGAREWRSGGGKRERELERVRVESSSQTNTGVRRGFGFSLRETLVFGADW